jgi:hypothetical protein
MTQKTPNQTRKEHENAAQTTKRSIHTCSPPSNINKRVHENYAHAIKTIEKVDESRFVADASFPSFL